MVTRKMKVLMLGWEFPPHITGGLGTACLGLTSALAQRDVDIFYFMPRLFGDESASYMHLIDLNKKKWIHPQKGPIDCHNMVKSTFESFINQEHSIIGDNNSLNIGLDYSELQNKCAIFSVYNQNYSDPLQLGNLNGVNFFRCLENSDFSDFTYSNEETPHSQNSMSNTNSSATPTHSYNDQIFNEITKYLMNSIDIAKKIDFDIIHAHDWMTYPAALALSQKFNRPVVLHVHSIENDRSAGGANHAIAFIEKKGLSGATSVIAVSQYTKDKIISQYNIPGDKIHVVHNGVLVHNKIEKPLSKKNENKKVLFLGRVTFQKGPDYFVEAAIRVLQFLPKTTFILAGSGDMLDSLKQRIRQAGMEKNFILPGFLKGPQVDEVLANADVYVMPSVSEPFGISALEAIYYDVPTIISRQSGVSEVINHALKVDFWDIDELSDLIIGALKYPELRSDLKLMAREEVRRLTWHQSAQKVEQVYKRILN